MHNNIYTERLCLNLLTLADHTFIRSLVNTKGWIAFIGDRNVHSEDDAIAYIDRILHMENLYYWVVRVRDTHTPVGIISFLKRSYLDHFDIGLAFLPEFHGKGYAYKAAKAVLSIVSQYPEHKHILATTVPQNTQSIQLLTRLGLHYEKKIKADNKPLLVYGMATVSTQNK